MSNLLDNDGKSPVQDARDRARRRINTPQSIVLEATPIAGGHLIPRQTARTHGYGAVSIGGRLVRAHRAAWEVHHGRRLPPSKVVRHRCTVRACIAKGHILSGPQRANLLDSLRLGGRRGVRLSPALVQRLRRDHAKGASVADLAGQLGVGPSAIRAAIRGRTWGWI
jgi:hypothetical protein